jgi:hypothetical protein
MNLCDRSFDVQLRVVRVHVMTNSVPLMWNACHIFSVGEVFDWSKH